MNNEYKPKSCSVCKYKEIEDVTYCADDFPEHEFFCTKDGRKMCISQRELFYNYPPRDNRHENCPLDKK